MVWIAGTCERRAIFRKNELEMENNMLTVNAAEMLGGEHQLWVTEADLGHGHATAGLVSISLSRDGRGKFYIESPATGGCYGDQSVIGDVKTWYAEDYFIALFPDEESMQAGARQLVTGFGDRLPVGVAHVLTSA